MQYRLIFFLLTVFLMTNLSAKRLSPKDVPPITVDNVEYRAPHKKMGVVEAWKDGKIVWEQKIYNIKFNDKLERDVQWVFIKKMTHKDNYLLIQNEQGTFFTLNLKTKKVLRIEKDVIPEDKNNTPWGKKMENGLQVRIRNFYDTKQKEKDFRIIFEVRNTTEKPVKICRWLSPLDVTVNSDLFEVKGAEGKLPFTGRFVTRRGPSQKDYVTIKPGATISVKYNLNWEYSSIKPGKIYSVVFNGNRMGPLPSSNKIQLKVTN